MIFFKAQLFLEDFAALSSFNTVFTATCCHQYIPDEHWKSHLDFNTDNTRSGGH